MKFLKHAFIAASLLAFSACATAPSAPAGPDSALNAPRIIALEGAQNFRDIGGYRTADGHRVKWGLIFRSAALSEVTAEDIARLNELGVTTVYDLRSTGERRSAPDAWTGEGAPEVVALDYEMDSSAIGVAMRAAPTVESVRAGMASFYPSVLTTLNAEYRDMFEGLIAGEGATLYHCTAGKDRTGVATALILTALGVPRETIYADYLMSNRYYHPAANPMMAQLPPEVVQALMGVDESYLRATFDAIESQYGTVENYLDTQLGVDAADIGRMRALYLE
jgi:protein-tyrosine phosphatase